MSESTATEPKPDASTDPPKPVPPPATDAPKGGDATAPARLPDDHPLVKTLAAQKDEIKALKTAADSGKSDAEKTAERLAEVEKRAAEAEARAARRDVAIEFRLSKDDAALLDVITDEKAMRSLAERLSQESDKKRGNRVPGEGRTTPPAKSDPKREFLRDLTGSD